MKCPNCSHVSKSVLLKCSNCGEVYDRPLLEDLQHLDYLLEWIAARQVVLGETAANRFRREAEDKRSALLARLLPEPEPAPEPLPIVLSEEALRCLALLVGTRSLIQGWMTDGTISARTARTVEAHLNAQVDEITVGYAGDRPELPAESDGAVRRFAYAQIRDWANANGMEKQDLSRLLNLLGGEPLELEPLPAAAPSAHVALTAPPVIRPAPSPKPAPAPTAPRKPREPLIRWDRLWAQVVEAAVSGLLLRWLRYLGAFLFVVSIGIVVVNFWNDIPQWGQVLIIFFIPAAFYGGGWVLRRRLGIVQTGGVLMGVGQVLLAVDFAAIYQFGGLTIPINTYWLISSAVCALIYLLTVMFIVRDEFFGYIGLAGIASTCMAAVALMTRSIPWPLAALAAFGVLSVEAGYRLERGNDKWREVGEAARRFPQIIIPMTLLALLLIPGDLARSSLAVAFILATAASGLLAWRFSGWVYTHAAVWLSVLAAIFTLRASLLPWVWYPLAGVVLSLIHVSLFRALSTRLQGDEPERRLHRLAFGAAGAGAMLISVVAGSIAVSFDYWPGVTGLAAAAAAIAAYSWMLRRPALVLAAGGLTVVPVSLAAWEWLSSQPQQFEWLMAVWGGLALIYLLLSASLRSYPEYGKWLSIQAHTITPVALVGAGGFGMMGVFMTSVPTLVVLAGGLAVYGISAVLNHGADHPGLAGWSGELFGRYRSSVFLYPLAALVPFFAAVAWRGSVLAWPWFGVILGAMMPVYIALGQRLRRVDPGYRLPFAGTAYLIGVVAVLISLELRNPLMASLYLVVGGLAGLAWVFRRPVETAAAGLVVLWAFGLSMDMLNVLPHAFTLGYLLLAGLVFIPLGIRLRRRAADQLHHLPLFWIGYAVSALAAILALAGRLAGFESEAPWIGAAAALMACGLFVYSSYTVHPWFAWAAVVAFPPAYWRTLDLLRVLPEWKAPALAGLAIGYLGICAFLKRTIPKQTCKYNLPLNLGAWGLAALGLLLTLPDTLNAFLYGIARIPAETLLGAITGQALVVGFVVLATVLYRSPLPLFLEPWLAFLPVTLAFIAFGEQLFGAALTSAQFGIVWAVLGVIHLAFALGLDQRGPVREELRGQMYGLHLGGYLLPVAAVLWSPGEPVPLLWSFGILISIFAVSAVLVHVRRHPAWEAPARWLVVRFETKFASVFRDLFFWLAAWTIPVWITMLLWHLRVIVSFSYLGPAAAALIYLAAAFLLQRSGRTYNWAFLAAGQFFMLISLLHGVGDTRVLLAWRGVTGLKAGAEIVVLGHVIVQAMATLYYAGSSAYFFHRKWVTRLYSYLASLLVWVPFTLAWIVFRFGGPDYDLAYPWLGLSATVLGAGYVLDRLERRRVGRPRVGFAHGPYLSGYTGLVYTVLWTWPERLTHLYILGGGILLALLSHAAVHYRRHDTWREFEGLFAGAGEAIRTVVRTGFLWVAAYAVPVWLVLLLAYNDVPRVWQGLALALAAPIYIAIGLAIRRADPGSTWPLFSAGYLLTAVGAMLTFDDQVLAIYVLSLDALVYAVSAYIFRQPIWLYLTTLLTPVIGLMVIEYRLDALPAPWVAGEFMGLSVVYLAIGRLFDRRRGAAGEISSYALPFYAPGYLLTAVALASSTDNRELALAVFLGGIAVYAWSARQFREPVFLYQAVWLAAVPYYLGMTYTRLEPAWYGIGWLPLIVAGLAAGRAFFHRRNPIRDLAHPALPFYMLAYALSVSMILIARGDPLARAVALAAAAGLYLYSARLFRLAWWLYPGLAALHAAVLTFLSLEPIRLPAPYQPVFLFPVTLAMGLLGSRLWKRSAAEGADWRVRSKHDRALPFALFALIDIVAGQTLSLYSWESGIVTAVGHAVLLGILAWQRADRRFAWGAIGFTLLGLGLRLAWAGLAWPRMGALAAGIGFGMFLIAWTADTLAKLLPDRRTGAFPHPRLQIWAAPLELSGTLVNFAGLAVALAFFVFGAEVAVALAFGGALLLGFSYRRRQYELGYLGVFLMEAAFVLVMLGQEVRQPQWYAIPAGLYFVGLGFFERRRGRTSFALLLESFGLIVMLLTSFVQSLDIAVGFWYFLLLLGETVLVIVWSAQQRRKAPFLIGVGATLANVIGQIVTIFMGGTTLIRWLIFGGLGLLILLAAIYAERWLIPRTQDVRDRLGSWS